MEQGKPGAWLIPLVASCLDMPEEDLDPRAALTQYGLDSLSMAELTAAIEDLAGLSVPEWLLLDCPTLESIDQFLCRDASVSNSRLERRVATPPVRQMLSDSRLPVDCQPSCQVPISGQQLVLLTGATGFLGSHILDCLLRETRARVICMVRPKAGSSPHQRLERAFQEYGLGGDVRLHRLEVIEGDLCQPSLGLPAHQFAGLADEVDTIYHSAATVNWAHSYHQLKPANVTGTTELIRFACLGRPKAFHFISTLAVCYSTLAPREVFENEKIRGFGEGLYLGYAQSKYVAECLIREAVDRGLRASVFRPSLLCGNSISGISNHHDLLSTLIKGCIQMGSAPDLDWLLDCCPVDHVSRAVVRLSVQENGGPFHILNPRKRHWRELILWMNLYGYPVSLIPYRDWLNRMELSSRQRGHPLHYLRSLFLRKTDEPGEPTIPELYEEGRRSRALAAATETALGNHFPACSALTPQLLDHYFSSFIERGFLPAPSRPSPKSLKSDSRTSGRELLSTILGNHFAEPALNIQKITPLQMETADSILTELTSWRKGMTCGLKRFRVAINSQGGNHPGELDLVLKDKARDAEIIEVGAYVARLCSEPLGHAYSQFKNSIGFSCCHLKELALYRLSISVDRLGRHMPAFYGGLADEDTQRWALLIEHLRNMRLMGSADEAGVWQPHDIQAALRGAAEIHGIWYQRGADLRNESWLGPVMSARDMTRMKVLWKALAEHSAPYFTSWAGDRICMLQRRLIESVDEWWSELESQPWTLIHNDFNPRNLALRDDGSDRLCVYDWELATLGTPQHDLAEFLCFVLTADVSHQELSSYLDFHRRELERSTGTAISAHQWRLGFEHSLYDLLINRFSLYVLIHRFRGLKFLPRLIKTWTHLNRLLQTRSTLTRMSA